MKPAPFQYHDPRTVDEVVSLLGQLGEDAKILAGGQSLVPMLNLRLVRPSVLIDLNGAFHARDWRESSYAPLRKISRTVERDEFGHSEMGYHFLRAVCTERRGRALAQALAPKWYSAALDMFGTACDAEDALTAFARFGPYRAALTGAVHDLVRDAAQRNHGTRKKRRGLG